MIKFKKKLKTV